MRDESRPSYDPESSGRLLFVLAFVAGALLRLILLGSPDLFGLDEGSWAVGARNLVEGGFDQLVGLSRTPLGEPSGTPVLFPALLSIMVRIFGPEEWAVRLPSAFAGLVGAFVVERIVRRSYGQPAGHIAGAFMALFPPLVAASRAATVEPTLVALGLGGIIFGLRAFEEDVPLEALLSGSLFGLGFLANGYAIGLFLLPLAVALACRPALFSLGETKKSLLLLVGSFVVVGGAHLLLVAVTRPAQLAFEVASRFGASSGSTPLLPPTTFSADLKGIVRTLFLFLPLAGVGLAYLGRKVGDPEIESGATGGERRLGHGLMWAVYGIELVVVVLVAGRLQLSTVPVMPALAALAGLGATALVAPAREAAARKREVSVAIVSGVVVVLASVILMATPDDPLFGGRRAPLPAGTALAAIAVTAAGAALLLAGLAKRLATDRLSPAFVAALLVVGGVTSARAVRHDLLTHRTGLRETAFQIEPGVAGLEPGALAFRAPEPEAIAFRLFRTGLSWSGNVVPETLRAEASTIRAWAYRDNEPAGPYAPSHGVRTWLAENARDVTAEVDARAGRKTGLRVFLPR